MRALYKRLRTQWDVLVGRYEVGTVQTEAEYDGVCQVRHSVRDQEFNRGSSEELPRGGGPWDPNVRYVRDSKSGTYVGLCRSTPLSSLPGGIGGGHDFSMVPAPIRERVHLVHGFSILPEHRSGGAAAAMFLHLYKSGLEDGALGAALETEPGLYPSYVRLGFRPLSRPEPRFGMPFILRMILLHHDQAHLQAIRSPLARVLARSGAELDDTAVRWFAEWSSTAGLDTGLDMIDDEDVADVPLLAGLSETGRQALLSNASRVRCDSGAPVIPDGDGAQWMALVEAGMVEILVDGKPVALRGEGDLIGEMAFVLKSTRTAEVRAVTDDTSLILLSRSAIKRLEDPADQVRVWENLARIVARKLASQRPG